MRTTTALLSLVLAIFLAACAETVGATHGDIQAPPSTASTSVATEDLVAQKGAASSRAQVDAANVKSAQAEVRAAKTAAELATAKADLATAQAAQAKDHADLMATTQALVDQQKAEASGRLYSYIGYAIPVGIAAAICIYEGWMTDAIILGIIAGCLIVLPMLFTWVLGHGKLLGTIATIGVVGWLAYRYRAKLPALVITAEADAKAIAAVAIADAKKAEAALAHVVSGGAWASAESDVKSALVKAYCGIKGIAVSAEHGVEAVLHLSKPTPANTIPTVAPPAAPPKA